MIDKFTFVIILIKLLGIQIILVGLIVAYLDKAGYYTIFIAFGSLLFAVASNCLLAHFLHADKKRKLEDEHNGQTKRFIVDESN